MNRFIYCCWLAFQDMIEGVLHFLVEFILVLGYIAKEAWPIFLWVFAAFGMFAWPVLVCYQIFGKLDETNLGVGFITLTALWGVSLFITVMLFKAKHKCKELDDNEKPPVIGKKVY